MVIEEVISVLDQALNLGPRAAGMDADTPLLGAIPELDSMAVVTVIAALEERFEISWYDDEIEATHFATVGSLARFVEEKLAA